MAIRRYFVCICFLFAWGCDSDEPTASMADLGLGDGSHQGDPSQTDSTMNFDEGSGGEAGSADAAGLLEDSGAAGMSDAGGIGGQADADGLGGQAGSGGIGGQAGMAGAGGMGGACTDHETFFADTLWPRVIEPTCLGCHATDGIAGNRRMTFLPMGSDRWWSHAEAGLTAVSTDFVDGRPLLTMKPTGQTPHTGGIVVQRNSEEYALLDEMAADSTVHSMTVDIPS